MPTNRNIRGAVRRQPTGRLSWWTAYALLYGGMGTALFSKAELAALREQHGAWLASFAAERRGQHPWDICSEASGDYHVVTRPRGRTDVLGAPPRGERPAG